MVQVNIKLLAYIVIALAVFAAAVLYSILSPPSEPRSVARKFIRVNHVFGIIEAAREAGDQINPMLVEESNSFKHMSSLVIERLGELWSERPPRNLDPVLWEELINRGVEPDKALGYFARLTISRIDRESIAYFLSVPDVLEPGFNGYASDGMAILTIFACGIIDTIESKAVVNMIADRTSSQSIHRIIERVNGKAF